MRLINEKNYMVIIGLLAVLALLIPHLVRESTTFIGEEPYKNLLAASGTLETAIEREYIKNPYDMILKASGKYREQVSVILPIISGVLCIIIFDLILKKLNIKHKSRIIILVTFAMSPPFIHYFSISNSTFLAIMFNSLGFLFFTKKDTISSIISFVLFLSAGFFGVFHMIISLALIFAYILQNKNLKKRYYWITGLLLLFSIIYYVPLYYTHYININPGFLEDNLIQYFISDLGSFHGTSVFIILLSLIGLLWSWKHKHDIYMIYIVTATLIIGYRYITYADIYISIILSVFAGLGISILIERRWEVSLVRNLTILIIICGLLFSVISYTKMLTEIGPDEDTKEALTWLSSQDKGTVFSHYSNGFFISYYSKNDVMIDSYFLTTPRLYERYDDMQTVLHDRNLEKTKNMLTKYNISYIFIDGTMKQYVWENEKRGLYFLVRNKETFQDIYKKDNIEIYKIMYASEP